jgi:glucose-1-phosphate adenylyltransferase
MERLLIDDFPLANDFGSEVIPGAKDLGMHIQAYLFDGYWEDIGTIKAFYEANLNLCEKVPNFSFYDRKVTPRPPVRVYPLSCCPANFAWVYWRRHEIAAEDGCV